MELIDEPIDGVKILKPFVFEDNRGAFVKTFHEQQFLKHGINFSVREEFFSTSEYGVIRGMHFQVPPYSHQKIVYCLEGKIIDVLLDLRKESRSYGQSVAFELSAANRHIVHIPIGIAHGFLALKSGSSLVYKTDSVYRVESDRGIHWNSFDFEWPIPKGVIPEISQRDQAHTALADFDSPF